MVKYNNNNQNRILKFINKKYRELSIEDIAKSTNLGYTTVVKYLRILYDNNLIVLAKSIGYKTIITKK